MMKRRTVRFRRDLHLWHALSLVIGSMVGTGIFLFVSPVAAVLIEPWAILLVWALGALIAGCGGLCLAELAASYPETGGSYVYLTKAYGPLVGFLYTWTKFLMIRVGSLAIPALAFTGFFADFFNLDPVVASEVQKVLAASLICIFTFVNILGVRIGGEIQTILTVVKVLCLLFVMAVGLLFSLGMLEPYLLPAPAALPVQASPRSWLLATMSALVPVLWTLGGWDEPTIVAEEIQKPQRNLPIAILGGLAFVSFLYMGVNASYLAILSPQEIATSGGSVAILAMKRALGPTMAHFVAFFLMIAALGVLNGMVLTGARIAVAAGFEQMFFRWFSQTHERSRTPQRALVLQGLLAIAAIVLMEDIYSLLLYTTVPYWIFSALMAMAVMIMRVKDPQRKRHFKVWLYPLPVFIYFATSLCMIVATFLDSWRNSLFSFVILLLGVAIYFLQGLLKRLLSPSRS